MSVGMTILVGIGGSLVAGLIGYLIFGRNYGGSLLLAAPSSARPGSSTSSSGATASRT